MVYLFLCSADPRQIGQLYSSLMSSIQNVGKTHAQAQIFFYFTTHAIFFYVISIFLLMIKKKKQFYYWPIALK